MVEKQVGCIISDEEFGLRVEVESAVEPEGDYTHVDYGRAVMSYALVERELLAEGRL